MKRLSKLLTILMLISMLLAVMPLDAAAAESYNVTGTVGEYFKFVFFSDNEDIVEASEYTGNVPGMKIASPSDGQLAIEGTPTQAGIYVLEITVYTQRTSGYNIVLTVTIQDKPTDGTPVVTKDPTGESVVEGESATFIAKATNVRQYVWQLGIADALIDAEDLPGYIGKGVKVSGWNTETLVIENIPKELDGAHIWCRFVGAEESVTSSSAVLKVTALDDATPVITKHPTDETVEEGGETVFVAKAKYTQIYTWQLVSPDGVIFDCDTVHIHFPALKVTGAKAERITLSNIPLELNGYKIQCMFTAGGTVVSNSAIITVNPKPTEDETVPTTEPTTEPTAEPTTEPTAPVVISPRPTDSNTDFTGKTHVDKNAGDSGDNTLLIVMIISIAAVAITGIIVGTILVLKYNKRK